jgi:hypothetical protein
MSGDPISSLPVDEQPPTEKERLLVEKYFKKNISTFSKIMDSGQDAIVVGLIYIVMSLPQVDTLLIRFFPSLENQNYVRLAVKGLIATILFYCVKYMYLIRK